MTEEGIMAHIRKIDEEANFPTITKDDLGLFTYKDKNITLIMGAKAMEDFNKVMEEEFKKWNTQTKKKNS